MIQVLTPQKVGDVYLYDLPPQRSAPQDKYDVPQTLVVAGESYDVPRGCYDTPRSCPRPVAVAVPGSGPVAAPAPDSYDVPRPLGPIGAPLTPSSSASSLTADSLPGSNRSSLVASEYDVPKPRPANQQVSCFTYSRLLSAETGVDVIGEESIKIPISRPRDSVGSRFSDILIYVVTKNTVRL